MSNKFKTVDSSELEDFDYECQAYGIDPKEFEIKEHDIVNTPHANGLFTTNGNVSVTRNNITIIYSSGNGTRWVADFTDDLRKGIFK